jgi:hypothetical protein
VGTVSAELGVDGEMVDEELVAGEVVAAEMVAEKVVAGEDFSRPVWAVKVLQLPVLSAAASPGWPAQVPAVCDNGHWIAGG